MTLEAEIRRLFRDFSIETVPREAERIGDFRALLPEGTRVYVADVPGSDREAAVATAAKLRRQGMRPVPHVSARRLRDEADLERVVARLARAAGVVEALVVGGDRSRPAGPFEDACSVLETGIFEEHGMRCIAFGAHPEGHPVVGDAALRRAIEEKADYAARSDADFRVVTQFCFDAAPIVDWDRRAREAGLSLPVHVGLPGLVSAGSLMRHARRCGVGASLRMLERDHRSVLRLARVVSPETTVIGLARYTLNAPESLLEQVHLYPFGGFRRTARWAVAIAEGRFGVHGDDSELSVTQRPPDPRGETACGPSSYGS